jgi:hypothetical protein
MLKKFSIALSAIIILIGINSCGDRLNTEEKIKKVVEKTDSLLYNLEGQKYEWASPKAYSTVMTYYPEHDIIFINENLKYRRAADAFNLYYFKDGNVIRFVGKKLEYFHQASSKKMSKRLTNLELYLDPDGDVISYVKIVDNQLASLEDADLEEVLSHSRELYNLVGDQEE